MLCTIEAGHDVIGDEINQHFTDGDEVISGVSHGTALAATDFGYSF
jgi:hypothetical protein